MKFSYQCLSKNRLLGVGEFFVAAVVAAIVDEFLGGGDVVLRGFPRVRFLAEEEAGTVQVNAARCSRAWQFGRLRLDRRVMAFPAPA